MNYPDLKFPGHSDRDLSIGDKRLIFLFPHVLAWIIHEGLQKEENKKPET